MEALKRARVFWNPLWERLPRERCVKRSPQNRSNKALTLIPPTMTLKRQQ